MEAVSAGLLAAVMFLHAWQLFGLSEPKTTGAVGAVGAIGLGGLVIFQPLKLLTPADPAGLSTSMVIWAIYAAAVAAVGLWNFDTRGFGFYSLFAALAMLLGQGYATAFQQPNLGGLLESLLLTVAFGILFFYWAVPVSGLRLATAWVLLVVSVLLGVLVGALLGGGPGLA